MQETLELIIDYLKGIWIKRRFIMIATWLICPIGWYAVSQLDNVYKSEARVYVDTQSILGPLLKGLTVQTNPEIQIRLMVKTLLSRPNLERISRMTDLDVQASDSQQYEAIIKRLKDNIKISSGGRENIYTLSFEDKSPEMAKNVVQSALTVFIENTLGENRSDSNDAQKFLNTQIREYEERLSASEAKLTDFRQRHSEALINETGGYYAALKAKKSRLQDSELELQEAQTRLTSAKAQLKGEIPKQRSSSNINSNNSITTSFDSRIQQFEEQLDILQLRYTDNHPDVKELLRRIDSLEKQRKKEVDQYYNSLASDDGENNSIRALDSNPIYQEMKVQVNNLENEVASLTVRVNNYRAGVKDLESKLHILPEIEAELTALNRGYNITKKKYEELLNRSETANLAKQADETTNKIQFRVIDPPRSPTKPSGPKRIILFLVVTVLAFGVGVGLSFVFSQINPVVTSSSQLSKATGIPIFGIVSASENLGLKAWHRKKTILFIISNVLLLTVLACFISYFVFPDAVQVLLQRIF